MEEIADREIGRKTGGLEVREEKTKREVEEEKISSGQKMRRPEAADGGIYL